MHYRNGLIACILATSVIINSAWAVEEGSVERSPLDFHGGTSSVPGEQIASWPVDPWMTAAQERQIVHALQQPWELPPIFGEPLERVIRTVAHTTGNVPFQIDRKALEEIGLKPEVSVTLDQQNIAIASALRIMLSSIDLTFQISGGVVSVTTREAAEDVLVTRVYDVTPLVASADQRSQRGAVGGQNLVEVIETTVSPETWEMLGGPSAIAATIVGDRALLVIPTTSEVHFQIDALLNRLNEVGFRAGRLGYYSGAGRQASQQNRIRASNGRLPRFEG